MYPRTMIYFASFNIKINAYFPSFFFFTVRIIQIANCYSNIKNIDHSITNLNTLLELIMRSGKGLGLITNLMRSFFSLLFWLLILFNRDCLKCSFLSYYWESFFICKCCKQHLRQSYCKGFLLDFALSKLWSLTLKFLQNKPTTYVFLAFSNTRFFKKFFFAWASIFLPLNVAKILLFYFYDFINLIIFFNCFIFLGLTLTLNFIFYIYVNKCTTINREGIKKN